MSSSPSCYREGTDAIDRPATSNVHQQLSGTIRRAALAPLDSHQGKMRRDNRQWQPRAVTTCRSPAPAQGQRERVFMITGMPEGSNRFRGAKGYRVG